MAVIYVITNEKNGKQYVGATKTNLMQRWKYHIADMNTKRCRDRKLYSAMRTYGKENFSIKEIENVTDDERFDREKYWIGKLNTYRDGYNETLGGGGKEIVGADTIDEIVRAYKIIGDITNTAKETGFSQDTIKKALYKSGENIRTRLEIMTERNGIPVDMLSMSGEYQMTFESINAAAEYIIKEGYVNGNKGSASQHIRDVCRGKKRKTAANHRWRYSVN